MKKWIPEALVIVAIIMIAAYGVAQTWTQTLPTQHDIDSIALSADGKIAVAVGSELPPIVSTNSGATWTTNATYHAFNRIACSADGTKLVAAFFSGFSSIYISTNSGNDWIQTASPSASWGAVASSADGVKLAAAIYNGQIYLSTNSGTSWATSTAPIKNWTSLASSADGTKIAAAASGDKIYSSTDSGTTWAPTGSASDSWSSIACSVDGRQLLASAVSGVYISTNSGGNWTLANTNVGPVASSADGSRLIICSGSTYTSSDSGKTWISNSVPHNNFPAGSSVASSADGNRLLVAPYRTGIFTIQLTPLPQISATASNANLALSWIVPSTNFVLQSSADLAGWTDLTNQPVLNLTNLQNQVLLPSPGSNVFFRLKTP